MHTIPVNASGRVSLATIGGVLMAATLLGACGSSDGAPGTGGRPGSGGASAGSGGIGTATGGASSGSGGSVSGTGGAVMGTGGASLGSGGSAAATGGAPGTGGTVSTGGASAGSGGSTGGASATGGRLGGSGGGATGQGGRGVLTLTSTSLTNGAAFLPTNTCAGANQSPPLTWTAGPAGTQSYAIVLLDTANTRYHWAIWNIPASVMTLPPALPAGASISTPVAAMQAITGSTVPAYQGPCPNGTVHTYVFTVYALDLATLPGLANGAMAQPVSAALQSHVLASGTLSGTSNAARP